MLQGNQGVDIISKAENGEKTFNIKFCLHRIGFLLRLQFLDNAIV